VKILRWCLLLAAFLPAGQAFSQAIPANGRFSLFTYFSERETVVGESYDFTEVVANFSLFSDPGRDSPFEFGLDTRVATYPGSEGRDERVSIYEAWAGYRGSGGRWRLRIGQMWLRELGGLGSVGGIFGEYRLRKASSFGQWRFGMFAGLEPKIREAGYVDGVEKGGVYAAVDGGHGRRHVLGWVLLRNEGLTERSVAIFTNFIPVGREFFLYQALEYDLEGPAELGDSELTYFFVNLRYSPVRLVDLQATYHRGRSIDTRAIADDVLDGRPVNPDRLDGLLFESGRFRLTVNPWRSLRVWAGYGRDKNNRQDEWTERVNYGLSFNNIGGVGFDFTATNSEIDRFDTSYDTTYVSIGKTLGPSFYLSLDYMSALSVFHYDDGSGGLIEVRPQSDRYSLSLNANLGRTFSLLLVGEWMDHDAFEEIRALTGLTIRF
jgi:hypothetical protein